MSQSSRSFSADKQFLLFPTAKKIMLITVLTILFLGQHGSSAFQPNAASHLVRTLPNDYLAQCKNRQKKLIFRVHTQDSIEKKAEAQLNSDGDPTKSVLEGALEGFPLGLLRKDGFKKLPPLQFEDMNVLFYDVFLIVNLSLSISFWVTHRLDSSFLMSAINEGSILSVFWILSGLYHGAFLMSAVDGHYGSSDERSGPKAAAALGLNTYIGAVNMRLVFALASAALHHREFGVNAIEQLIPLEIGCGIFLMTMWRTLHSYVTPRI